MPTTATATTAKTGEVEYIDITPTWSVWASIYARFAETGETQAARAVRKDLENMAFLADAFAQLSPTLTQAQQQIVASLKQGISSNQTR